MVASALDIAVRHQAYIEGVKNHTQEEMDPTAEALAILLAALLLKWGYKQLGDMPKRVLREFTAEFNRRADKLLETFRKGFTKTLKEIAKVDALITSMNFALLTGKPAVSPNTADTWTKINNDTLSTGHLPAALLKDFVRSAKNQIALLIKRAYVEKWTPAQLLEALNGTKGKNFKDGLLHKLKNQFNTVQQTLIQHVHQWLNYNFGRLFFDYYEWVAVLDSRTTDICRHRHGHVFQYGKGPRPPAHYNCRSTIVGISGVEAFPVPNSFYAWLVTQPVAVQNDMLGRDRARQLRAGKLKAEGLPKFDGTKKIPPSDLVKYQPNMVK